MLCEILNKKRLLASASNGYIRQNKKVICFQDVPLYSLAENIKFENEHINNGFFNEKDNFRYEAFGLRFNKGHMFQKGARPVIYSSKDELDRLPDDEQWRCVQLDLSCSDNIIDWTHEREWRIQGDFSFEYEEVEVILGCKEYYKKFIDYYSGRKLLDKINGIIVLNSLLR